MVNEAEDILGNCDDVINKMEVIIRILNDSECQKELTKQNYRELCLELAEGHLETYKGLKVLFGGEGE